MKDLQTTQRDLKDRTIQSLHSYDILQIDSYKTRFQYYRVVDRKVPEEWLSLVNMNINEDGEEDEGAPKEANEYAS
jgi:hypothetical protein